MPGGWSFVGTSNSALVEIGIKLGADRLNLADVVALEHLQQLAFGEFDAGQQVLRHLVGILAGVRRNRRSARLMLSADAEGITGEIGGGIKCRFRALALGPLPKVLHVGGGAQQPVLVLRRFFLQLGDLQVLGVGLDRDRVFHVHGLVGTDLSWGAAAPFCGVVVVSSAIAKDFQLLLIRDGSHDRLPRPKIK